MPIVRLLKCLLKPKKICFNAYGVTHVDEKHGINTQQVMYQSVVNFTKIGVPFRNTVLIRPLYNECDQLSFLMGISYNDILDPPLHIQPTYTTWDDVIAELGGLPFSIVLTTCSAPFIIKYVNNQWESMCGYKSVDVLDKTFSVIQGNNPENINSTKQFKKGVTMSLASWRLMLFLTLAILTSPTGSYFYEFKRACKFFISQKCFGFSKMDKINVQFPIQETYLGKSLFVRP